MRVIWQCTKKQFKEGWLKTLVNTHNMQITDGTIPGLYLRYYAGTNRIIATSLLENTAISNWKK